MFLATALAVGSGPKAGAAYAADGVFTQAPSGDVLREVATRQSRAKAKAGGDKAALPDPDGDATLIHEHDKAPLGRVVVYAVGEGLTAEQASALEAAVITGLSGFEQAGYVAGSKAKRDIDGLDANCQKPGECAGRVALALDARFMLRVRTEAKGSGQDIVMTLTNPTGSEVVAEKTVYAATPADIPTSVKPEATDLFKGIEPLTFERGLAAKAAERHRTEKELSEYGMPAKAGAKSTAAAESNTTTAPTAPTSAPVEERKSWKPFPNTVPFWAAAMATTASLAMASMVSLDYAGRVAGYRDTYQQPRRIVDARHIAEDRARINDLELVGNVMWGVSGGLILATVALGIFSDWSGGVTVTPTVSTSGAGAALGGSF
jgi:hypothetical protein